MPGKNRVVRKGRSRSNNKSHVGNPKSKATKIKQGTFKNQTEALNASSKRGPNTKFLYTPTEENPDLKQTPLKRAGKGNKERTRMKKKE